MLHSPGAGHHFQHHRRSRHPARAALEACSSDLLQPKRAQLPRETARRVRIGGGGLRLVGHAASSCGVRPRQEATGGRRSPGREDLRQETYRLRTAARSSYYAVRLLADPEKDDALLRDAEQAIAMAREPNDAETLDELEQAVIARSRPSTRSSTQPTVGFVSGLHRLDRITPSQESRAEEPGSHAAGPPARGSGHSPTMT